MSSRRPPSHSDSRDTLDELDPVRSDTEAAESHDDRPWTGRVRRVDPADFAPTEADEWEWAKQLRATVATLEQRVESAEAKADFAARKLDKASKVVWSGAGLIGVGVVAVVKLAFSAGDSSATTRQHLTELADLRKTVSAIQIVTIPHLSSSIATNAATIAALRDYLDQISRLGAVRVQGPPPQPLLPGEP